jgi:hypothetical protein
MESDDDEDRGGNCDIDVDECASSPCANGATCTESAVESAVSFHAYQCTCVAGFANGVCEYDFIAEFETECTVVESASAVQSRSACNETSTPGHQYTFVEPAVTELTSEGVSGFTSYLLTVSLADVDNVYSIYGTVAHPLTMPAAYQEPAPFGTDIGGVNPVFWEASPSSQYDSWLTMGVTEGITSGEIASTGITFDDWNADADLVVQDGAIFWMEPDAGPGGSDIVIGQVTVRSGSSFTASVNMQGRTGTDRVIDEDTGLADSDWNEVDVLFTTEQLSSPIPPIPSPPKQYMFVEPAITELTSEGVSGFTSYLPWFVDYW